MTQRAELSPHTPAIIFAISMIAALRVFLFSAAFPFFCNVDEQAHFDAVVKYSRGYLPRAGDLLYDPAAADMIVRYGVLDYFNKPEDIAAKKVRLPLCLLPAELASSFYEGSMRFWQSGYNHEAFSPPAYYYIAGRWFNLGKYLGQKGLDLLYWTRFMNMLTIALLVWLSYAMARRFYPGSFAMRIGLPLLAAFIPQDVFYAINSDSLSPLFSGLAFYLMLRVYFSDQCSWRLCFFAGIAAAAAFLVKFTNIVMLGVVVLIAALKLRNIYAQSGSRDRLLKILFALATAFLPSLVWLGRNRVFVGDLWGTAAKIKMLGWSVKPLRDLFLHPIFSLQGIAVFWNNLVSTLWRGELVWHLSVVASKMADLFYSLSSLVFIAAATVALFRPASRSPEGKDERFVTAASLLTFILSILLMAGGSILFDFGACWSPSRDYPYITSGRLILGMFIPFLILYIKGLEAILGTFKKVVNPVTVILVIVIAITVSEVSVTSQLFTYKYNWFHMRGY